MYKTFIIHVTRYKIAPGGVVRTFGAMGGHHFGGAKLKDFLLRATKQKDLILRKPQKAEVT
jgi:hypothetical protein